MIGRSGERGSGISVIAARHDDDDDNTHKNIYEGHTYIFDIIIYIYIYIYIYKRVNQKVIPFSLVQV